MKTCFVIMPYGGDSAEKRTHYLGVFQSIIMPAASRAGYETKRSDLAGAPGNITRDIIESLLDADIVIADLTEANANVFFELGIRHAFRKSGTIHLIDETHPLVFDIGQYRAIKYSQTLASLPKVIDQIVDAIRRREEQVGRADNPVHDAVAHLPVDIRSIGDNALRKQLAEAQKLFQDVAEERDNLVKKIREIDPSGLLGKDDELSVDDILDLADQRMRTTGQFVLLSLTSAAEKGVDAFVRELRTSLKSPNLSVNDLVEISNMCSRFGLDDHRRATLEVARSRYPAVKEVLLGLAHSYFTSPNPKVRDTGRAMLEQSLAVEYSDGEPVIRKRKDNIDSAGEGIGVLSDHYLEIGRPDWVLSLTKSAEKIYPGSPVIARNKARAYERAGDPIAAEAEYKRAIAAYPDDDLLHAFYGSFLDDNGKYEEAYKECERAAILDTHDANRFLGLAVQILNRGLFRDASGAIVAAQGEEARTRVALPLMIRAVQIDQASKQRVVGILVRRRALDEARAIADDQIPTGNYNEVVLRLIAAASPE